MKKGEVRLSQCMIVKNEEKNIRRALEWAKDIAFEQIVVDTGSTDNTVKIAEEMGATVYHFEWIDDFSAAKNYALDKANGNWIAFLDADEYMTEKDAAKLMEILIDTEKKASQKWNPNIIRSKWIHLGDRGEIIAVSIQDRVFRNLRNLRYENPIHEMLKITGSQRLICLDCRNMLSIMHTGYSDEAYRTTKKLDRNILLLEKEWKKDSANYDIASYLGDSYWTRGIKDDKKKAEKFYRIVMEQDSSKVQIRKELYENAGINLLRIINLRSSESEEKELFEIARKLGYPSVVHPDIYFFIGSWLFGLKRWKEAKKELERVVDQMESYKGINTLYSEAKIEDVYTGLAICSQQLNQPQDVVRYGMLALRLNRYLTNILVEILSLLRKEPGEAEHCDGTWGVLTKLYDMNNLKDQLFILKCAKAVGFISLEERVYDSLPEEEKKQISLRKQEKETENLDKNPFGISIRNSVDRRFVKWALDIHSHSAEELTESIREKVKKLEENARSTYQSYVQYYQKYPFWGNLDPEQDIWAHI